MKKITLLFQVNNVIKFTLTNLWTGCLQLRVIIKLWIHFLQQQFNRSCNIHFVELTPVTSGVSSILTERKNLLSAFYFISYPLVTFPLIIFFCVFSSWFWLEGDGFGLGMSSYLYSVPFYFINFLIFCIHTRIINCNFKIYFLHLLFSCSISILLGQINYFTTYS